MKVIMYMAITPNGMIATEDDDSSWITEAEWKSFSGMIKKYKNMVIGRRTYEIMLKNGEFDRTGLGSVKTIVLTRRQLKVRVPRSVMIARSPRAALDALRGKVDVIMVCGGGGLNASFLREKLVDEIYLDVEPLMLGKGIRLFAEADFAAELRLIDTKKLSKDEIQLHYKVVR